MTETTPHKTLKVDLGERSYPIHIGRGLLERVGQLIADYSKSKRVAVVTDETVFDLHGHTLTSALSDYAVTWIIRPAGEAQKQLSVIEDVIAISCDTKARIVAQDEREGGIRALLNLGHSFAHALELDAGYDGNLLHGEAVSVGMDMAFAYSAAHGFCDNTQALKVSTHLKRLEMPCIETQTARFSKAAKLTDLMGQDKKNEDGKITLILTRAIGDAFVQKSVKDTDVEAFLSTLA